MKEEVEDWKAKLEQAKERIEDYKMHQIRSAFSYKVSISINININIKLQIREQMVEKSEEEVASVIFDFGQKWLSSK